MDRLTNRLVEDGPHECDCSSRSCGHTPNHCPNPGTRKYTDYSIEEWLCAPCQAGRDALLKLSRV